MKGLTARKKKAAIISFSALALIILIGFASGYIRIHIRKTVPTDAQLFIENLGTGYNLGNSLDVCDWNSMFENLYGVDTETLWWGPVITEEFVDLLAQEGFGVIRVPVTYMNHIDVDGNIDPAWLDRVEEVVGWITEKGMYCIIDIHHDTGNDGWIRASKDSFERNHVRVSNMITQIAERFKEYDDHLILESFNEMVDEKNHWNRVPYASLMAHNKWNQLFVDTVRNAGGNNSSRYLLINTYAATVDRRNLYYFDMPHDMVDGKLIAGVHNYVGLQKLEKSFSMINLLKKRGYPIIIGEFGTMLSSADRAEHAKAYVEISRKYGFCPIWWDNNVNPQTANPSYAIFDRENCIEYFPDIINALTAK